MTDLTPWKFAEQHQTIEYYEKLARKARRSGRFGYANRSADASHSSLLRVSTKSGIAIAALCILYFALQLARAL